MTKTRRGRNPKEVRLDWTNSVRRKTGTIPMPPVSPHENDSAKFGRRWGVILAGGDGTRLRNLTKHISGDDRPKQFCPLFGGRTLLGQTLWRSSQTIPREQIMVSLSAQHREWYTQEDDLHASQRVVQPMSRGTAPPILHGLLCLARLDPHALVAILPSDHHYTDEGAFACALEFAFDTAAQRTDSVVLLGARPNYPEVEYGWIELGSTAPGGRWRNISRARLLGEAYDRRSQNAA